MQVTRILDSIVLFHGYPVTLRPDQTRPDQTRPDQTRPDSAPAFTWRALNQWTFAHGVKLRLIQPGDPNTYGVIESLNGSFLKACQIKPGLSESVHPKKTLTTGGRTISVSASFLSDLSDVSEVSSGLAKC